MNVCTSHRDSPIVDKPAVQGLMMPGMTLESCMQLLLDSTLLDNRSGVLCDASALG